MRTAVTTLCLFVLAMTISAAKDIRLDNLKKDDVVHGFRVNAKSQS